MKEAFAETPPTPARPRVRRQPAAAGAITLPVADGHSADELRAIVDAINAGAKATLVYRGDGWLIEVAS